MKTITFKEILGQLGIQSSDDFYDAMKPYWGEGADAILTYDPKREKAEIGSIYSNDWFNVNSGKILLARLNLPNKEKFNQEWYSIIYEAEFNLKRSQESNYEVF